MSDNASILPEGFGTPLAWLFNSSNEVLLDNDNRPLSHYLVEFEYTYDEEEDDLCSIKFEFENIQQLNLQYLRQDVILLVQWGYLLPGGTFLKSPKRKVAIRDLSTNYDKDKIALELKCTDLVAYINSFKLTTTRKFENPNAEIAIDAVGKSEDNFLDFTREVIAGQFQATITDERNSVRIQSNGAVQNAEYNPETGEYKIARDNTAVPKKFYHKFYSAKIINGKGKSVKNAIRDYLKSMDAMSGLGGPYVADTTDDTIHMRQRNFQQAPFKNYTFAKNTGELLSFKSNTNTRKVKEDIAATNAVNPETKLIDATQVVTIDNSKTICIYPNNDLSETPVEITTERIDKEIELYRKDFKYNIENPLQQKELPDLKILDLNKNPKSKDPEGFYQKAEAKRGFEMVKIPAREILMLPYAQTVIGERKDKEVEAFTNSQVLLGYMVEKIQRKYEASATVLGDPSLIKGKIYGFFNLSNLDKGLWYATKVSHKISYGKGYTCDMTIIKKPATITIDRQMAEITVKNINEKIGLENKYIEEQLGIYEKGNDYKTNYDELDENYDTEQENNNSNIYDMGERLDFLNSEERFTLGKTE